MSLSCLEEQTCSNFFGPSQSREPFTCSEYLTDLRIKAFEICRVYKVKSQKIYLKSEDFLNLILSSGHDNQIKFCDMSKVSLCRNKTMINNSVIQFIFTNSDLINSVLRNRLLVSGGLMTILQGILWWNWNIEHSRHLIKIQSKNNFQSLIKSLCDISISTNGFIR